ncbi:MAG: hypothetical protein AAGC53_05750 [Actinomycetota bacterium]
MALVPTIPGLEIQRVTPESPLYSEARRLHAECYLDAGYVSPEDIRDDGWIHDIWVPVSQYFAAVDSSTDEVVGTCRAIRPSVRGLPAFLETPIDAEAIEIFGEIDPNRCFEISAFATRRIGLQNMAISAALYSAVMQLALAEDRAYLIALMDNRFLRIMRRWFQFPFESIGNASMYMGSTSTPVAMYVPRVVELYRDELPDSLAFFCGDISLQDLDDLIIDLRDRVPDYRAKIIDLSQHSHEEDDIKASLL